MCWHWCLEYKSNIIWERIRCIDTVGSITMLWCHSVNVSSFLTGPHAGWEAGSPGPLNKRRGDPELRNNCTGKKSGVSFSLTAIFLLFSGYKVLSLLEMPSHDEKSIDQADVYVHVTLIKKWDICAGAALLNALGKGTEFHFLKRKNVQLVIFPLCVS